MKIDVLDHGFVRLVDSMGSDLSISRAARVSYDAPPREEDKGLISYLMKNSHTSPFESVVMTFEIKCPLFVARQWHRHRTWSYNEVSARYTKMPEEFYLPDAEKVGRQSKDNKQMRDLNPEGDRVVGVEYAVRVIEAVCRQAHSQYRYLLALGVPRELARSVLPLATYTRFFGTVSLHNLFHFLSLRLDEKHAQYEIVEYAKALLQLVAKVAPIATVAFEKDLGIYQEIKK